MIDNTSSWRFDSRTTVSQLRSSNAARTISSTRLSGCGNAEIRLGRVSRDEAFEIAEMIEDQSAHLS